MNSFGYGHTLLPMFSVLQQPCSRMNHARARTSKLEQLEQVVERACEQISKRNHKIDQTCLEFTFTYTAVQVVKEVCEKELLRKLCLPRLPSNMACM